MEEDAKLLGPLLYPGVDKWKEICRECGVSDEEIYKIEQSSGQDNFSCLKKGLDVWCKMVSTERNRSKTTLFVLVEALRKVKHEALVSKILRNWFRLSSVVEMQRQRKGNMIMCMYGPSYSL